MGLFTRDSSNSKKAKKPKKSKGSKTTKKRKLPERKLAPVDEIVEQGLMVADVATRMTVKNAIIRNALGRKADYHEQEIIEMVRDTVIELAEEREQDAEHIQKMRSEIRARGLSSWSESDYSGEDSRTLRHRQEVYAGIAVDLRQRAEDEEYLAVTAEKARSAAWSEIGDALKEKASHPYYSGGTSEEYKRARDERIQLLIQRDLTSLVRNHARNGGSADDADHADGIERAEKSRRIARKKKA